MFYGSFGLGFAFEWLGSILRMISFLEVSPPFVEQKKTFSVFCSVLDGNGVIKN